MIWLSLLSVAAFATTSAFEKRFGTFATVGLAPTVVARIDRLLKREPYFEDLILGLHRAYDAREARAIDEFLRPDARGSREDFLTRGARARARVIQVLGVASFLEPGDDDLSALTARLIAALDNSDDLTSLLERLEREESVLDPADLSRAVGGCRGLDDPGRLQ